MREVPLGIESWEMDSWVALGRGCPGAPAGVRGAPGFLGKTIHGMVGMEITFGSTFCPGCACALLPTMTRSPSFSPPVIS